MDVASLVEKLATSGITGLVAAIALYGYYQKDQLTSRLYDRLVHQAEAHARNTSATLVEVTKTVERLLQAIKEEDQSNA